MTLNLSSEKMMELAKIVYPGRKVAISAYGDGHRVLVQMEGEFKPSLTGNQQYRAQALDVIVAAFHSLAKPENPADWGRFVYDPGWMHACQFEFGQDREEIYADDLLTASAMALLADRGNG